MFKNEVVCIGMVMMGIHLLLTARIHCGDVNCYASDNQQ